MNNETIGQSAEYALCKCFNISCNISENRINKDIVDILINTISSSNIESKLPSKIMKSIGHQNSKVDFILENKETLSLKTLKKKQGKICPQIYGQPSLQSWDTKWNLDYKGEKNRNCDRWEFIKSNIHNYLNIMIDNIYCCDYLLIITNCKKTPNINFYKLKDEYLNYFTNQEIIYSNYDYIEKWNNKKKKYNEMSSTIYFMLDNKKITIGEFQFHINSRKQVKFRFDKKFVDLISLVY